jgi:hypothetical protein
VIVKKSQLKVKHRTIKQDLNSFNRTSLEKKKLNFSTNRFIVLNFNYILNRNILINKFFWNMLSSEKQFVPRINPELIQYFPEEFLCSIRVIDWDVKMRKKQKQFLTHNKDVSIHEWNSEGVKDHQHHTVLRSNWWLKSFEDGIFQFLHV